MELAKSLGRVCRKKAERSRLPLPLSHTLSPTHTHTHSRGAAAEARAQLRGVHPGGRGQRRPDPAQVPRLHKCPHPDPDSGLGALTRKGLQRCPLCRTASAQPAGRSPFCFRTSGAAADKGPRRRKEATRARHSRHRTPALLGEDSSPPPPPAHRLTPPDADTASGRGGHLPAPPQSLPHASAPAPQPDPDPPRSPRRHARRGLGSQRPAPGLVHLPGATPQAGVRPEEVPGGQISGSQDCDLGSCAQRPRAPPKLVAAGGLPSSLCSGCSGCATEAPTRFLPGDLAGGAVWGSPRGAFPPRSPLRSPKLRPRPRPAGSAVQDQKAKKE